MSESLESKALRLSANLFKRSVDPDAIVYSLYAKGLLTIEERSKATLRTVPVSERVNEVYVSLERRVTVKPNTFHELVIILRSVTALRPVGDRLRGQFVGCRMLLSVM